MVLRYAQFVVISFESFQSGFTEVYRERGIKKKKRGREREKKGKEKYDM